TSRQPHGRTERPSFFVSSFVSTRSRLRLKVRFLPRSPPNPKGTHLRGTHIRGVLRAATSSSLLNLDDYHKPMLDVGGISFHTWLRFCVSGLSKCSRFIGFSSSRAVA